MSEQNSTESTGEDVDEEVQSLREKAQEHDVEFTNLENLETPEQDTGRGVEQREVISLRCPFHAKQSYSVRTTVEHTCGAGAHQLV